MANYRYTVENSEGLRFDGHVDAASVQEARQKLEQEGYRVLQVVQVDVPAATPPPQKPLTADEAGELVEYVAELGTAELPLAPGLRAAGDESGNARLAKVFYYLADELDQGRSFEEVLESSPNLLPPHISRLILAAIRTGQLGPALTELVEHYRSAGALRRGISDGLAYPVLVAVLAVLVLGFIVVFVAGGFESVFEDFGMELPLLTILFFWFRHVAIWLVPLIGSVALVVALSVRWQLGPVSWHRLLASTPLVGPIWHWLSLLEWMGLVRVMVRNGVTLLDALRYSAGGTTSANVSDLSNTLADGIARGRSLSQMMASQRQLPASLVPLVSWGEQSGLLPDSLKMGCEMLEDRVRMRSYWLHTALPPLLLIAIGCIVPFIFGALFLPLMRLVSSLS